MNPVKQAPAKKPVGPVPPESILSRPGVYLFNSFIRVGFLDGLFYLMMEWSCLVV